MSSANVDYLVGHANLKSAAVDYTNPDVQLMPAPINQLSTISIPSTSPHPSAEEQDAAEYVERNPDLEDKRIDVVIELVNGMLFVTVKNRIKTEHEQSALELRTSKPVKEAHGYGSRVVKKIVERYNGYVKYLAESGEFTASALLCVKQ